MCVSAAHSLQAQRAGAMADSGDPWWQAWTVLTIIILLNILIALVRSRYTMYSLPHQAEKVPVSLSSTRLTRPSRRMPLRSTW